MHAINETAAALTTLVELHVNGNDYTSLPEEIGRLSALHKLTLRYIRSQIDTYRLKRSCSFNAFTSLPTSLSLLTALNTLGTHPLPPFFFSFLLNIDNAFLSSELGGCKLATWPACFSTLARLAVLNLANNPTVAAEGVVALPALRRFRGPDALRNVLVPAAAGGAVTAPHNSALINWLFSFLIWSYHRLDTAGVDKYRAICCWIDALACGATQ